MTKQVTAAELKIAWAQACRASGVEPTAMFVEFDATKPAVKRYNTLMSAWMRPRRLAEIKRELGNLMLPGRVIDWDKVHELEDEQLRLEAEERAWQNAR